MSSQSIASDRRYILTTADQLCRLTAAALAGRCDPEYPLPVLADLSRRLLVIADDFNRLTNPERPLLPDDDLLDLVTARAAILRRLRKPS